MLKERLFGVFDEEIREIEEREFNCLKMLSSVKEKILKYCKLLKEISGEERELAGCLIKPKFQKNDLVTDIYLPFQVSTTSRVSLSGISDYIKVKELNLLGYEEIGEFHYHAGYAAYPSPADERIGERIRILSSSSLLKLYPKIFLKGNVSNLKFSGEEIFIKPDSRFLENIEIRTKKSFPNLLSKKFEKIFKRIGIKTFEDRLRDAELKVTFNLIIHYAYNVILNKYGEIYSEVIYQPICPACGPYPIKFKRIGLEFVEDWKKLDEEEMRKNLEERVIYGSSRLKQKIRELDEKERMLLWSKYI